MVHGQQSSPERNFAIIKPGESPEEIVRKAANVVPAPRQQAWQEFEFTAFTHFGMDTFTDREWGLGTENPSQFNPTAFDARQWVRVIKAAGMKMLIVTAKHHDGFCLWPSKYTDHSVKNSPWRHGKGDVVRDVSEACREYGLKFGVYLSPWDLHERTYGDSPRYNEFFRNQLRELLSNYGEVSEVWFDGANGEGPNGKKQVYDWPSYYKVIRELQPGAVIFGMGPDVRWVGTESGYGRETEWSVVPDMVRNLDAIAAGSQQYPVDAAFVPRDMTSEDLGSRERIKNARALVWYPAETDVSIRPGWFYHTSQDDQVKTPESLVDIYYNSVGKNSVLLLNIPPDKRGRIHASDIRSLSGVRKILDQTFSKNLLDDATVTASSERPGHEARFVIDHDRRTYWSSQEGRVSATLIFDLPRAQRFDRAMFQESIQVGQRIESFHLDAWQGDSLVELARGTTIGYKRLLRFPPVTARKVRLVIEQSRTSPTLSAVGLFKSPPMVSKEPNAGVHTFSIGDNAFLLDGKPFQIISGEMHFARIPPECWRDRFRMAKAMGLNTIATYIFWNYQEPEKGHFVFDGNADVARFVSIAREESLWVIIRPSPYACAEWEFGGYPWWLLKEQGVNVRSKDKRFLELSRRYFNELGKQLAPLQITRGGNIIMVQLENEYGSYGDDKEYLRLNKDIIRDAGFDAELYTCDGPSQMPRGYLPGLLPAVNGLDNVTEVKALINTYHDHKGPYFIAEWYPAWFDSWGLEHHVVPAESYVKTLDDVLSAGLSINMYMVHGGTTRGFMNGANYDMNSPFLPQTSSYDYDAPIDEAGNATPKYFAFRDVIKAHLPSGVTLPNVPPRKGSMTIPTFRLTEAAPLFSNLPDPVISEYPQSFEDLHQAYGYVLYRCSVPGPQKGELRIRHLRDFALVFVNGKRSAVLDRRLNQEAVTLDVPAGAATIDILVENLGRINYGPYLNDNRKGITEHVTFGDTEIKSWKMYRFPFQDLQRMKFTAGPHIQGPIVRRGSFSLDSTVDTYLDMREWGKGCVWVNGRNVGRYWNIGPQQTLYLPGPWLKRGENSIDIFEMLEESQDEIGGLNRPILDETGNPVVTLKGRYNPDREACIATLSVKGAAAEIRYTLDGSEPIEGSKVYTSELTINRPTTIYARAFRRGRPSENVAQWEVHPSLSTGRSIAIAFPFSGRYAGGGSQALVDGFLGSSDPGDGFWQGYEGNNLDAVVDLGGLQRVAHLSISSLQDTRSWVFHPTEVEFLISSDGKNFVSVGKSFETLAGGPMAANVKMWSQELKETRARFIRVVAKNTGTCPDWHPGRGGKAWIFVDELIIQ